MEKSEHKGYGWIIALVVLLLLYPLSLGPLAWLQMNGYLPESVVVVLGATIYAPLGWLVGSNEWCGELYVWYLSFWGINI
ncbi:MAG: hypothetical protein JKY95_16845 [Planctomycetaceae bacterium]|nr:hypothetical protein [Planctomycetaceae bacterium]